MYNARHIVALVQWLGKPICFVILWIATGNFDFDNDLIWARPWDWRLDELRMRTLMNNNLMHI